MAHSGSTFTDQIAHSQCVVRHQLRHGLFFNSEEAKKWSRVTGPLLDGSGVALRKY
jgi:hypothetical protein